MTETAPADAANDAQPHALVEVKDHVLVVTMNRPEARNALSGEMLAIMEEAWGRANEDDDVRVVHPHRGRRLLLRGRRPQGDVVERADRQVRVRRVRPVGDPVAAQGLPA